MGSKPIVSAIITVFNKAGYLPATIASLRRQMTDERAVEYIIVDDASSDNSVSILRDTLRDAPHVRIITHERNAGPSIRLNQGGQAASAPYLYFLDGDDLACPGAMHGMLTLLQREQADLVYGKAKRGQGGGQAIDEASLEASYRVTDRPLAYIMKGGFVRMTLMCKRDLFMRAGGADETIFVQDESLPLRLAAHAKRLVDWQAQVICMPGGAGQAGHVSSDKTQLHHDAFFAHAHALAAFGERHPDVASKLYARAVSAYWKYGKRQDRAALLHPGFWRYLQAKCFKPSPRQDVLDWMAAELKRVPNIRRPTLPDR